MSPVQVFTRPGFADRCHKFCKISEAEIKENFTISSEYLLMSGIVYSSFRCRCQINAFPIGSCVFINIHLRELKFANSLTCRVIYVALASFLVASLFELCAVSVYFLFSVEKINFPPGPARL